MNILNYVIIGFMFALTGGYAFHICSELEKQVKTLRTEVYELKGKIRAYEIKLNDYDLENESLKKSNEDLTKKYSDLRSAMDILMDGIGNILPKIIKR